MHASQLADLAGWVAIFSSSFVYGETQNTALDAKEYWVKSKCRSARWNSTLRMFDRDLRDPDRNHNPWPALEIVIDEIVVSEILTRVMSSAFVVYDQHSNGDELKGIAHSLFISHMEVKNRTMRMLLHSRALNEMAFDRINHLRRQVERWTDLFLSRLPNSAKASNFGFDKQRVVNFASERAVYSEKEFRQSQQVLLSSMNQNLRSLTSSYPANPDLNQAIAAGVLGCFANDRFDDYGLPKSSQLLWLEKSHNDTQLLIDSLDQLENDATQA